MDTHDTLLALASLATRAETAEAALEDVLRLIAQALKADSGAITLLDPDTGRLETESRSGLPAGEALSFALGQGLPGWVALYGKPSLIADTRTDPRYRAQRMAVRCQIAAPLLAADGQVLGVITLDRDQPGGYGPDDLNLLSHLTEEAGGVMRRLWELGHLRGKARQLEALLTTGQSLVAQLAPQELFDTLTRDARQMLGARASALYLVETAASVVRLASYCGSEDTAPQGGDLPVDACFVSTPIHTRRPVSFADVRSPEFLALADLPRDPELVSVLAAPVAYEGEVLGVLAVFLGRIHRFDNVEKRLCAALAGLGAVALQNARLYARVFASEESLRKHERLTTLGLLSAEIAHEIRNPLTVLKLLHGGLGADFPEGDPRRTDLRVIAEKLGQLEDIVTRVLNFGRAPSSLQTPCSLGEIVEDTLVLVRLKLAQAKIQLRYTRPERPLVIKGNKGQLQQVLLNLVINAMHAMPAGGTITLTPAAQAPVATLEVADTGTGIPEAIQGRIFDSFLSGRPDGTGLGLSIAKRILESHHGNIALVATGPEGTTFRITLPLSK